MDRAEKIEIAVVGAVLGLFIVAISAITIGGLLELKMMPWQL